MVEGEKEESAKVGQELDPRCNNPIPPFLPQSIVVEALIEGGHERKRANSDLSTPYLIEALTDQLSLLSGPPSPPANCSVVNQTTDSLEVRCSPGFDGGLRQRFVMVVADLASGEQLANATEEDAPTFTVLIPPSLTKRNEVTPAEKGKRREERKKPF